jgi:large subunit ribosomal protein L6
LNLKLSLSHLYSIKIPKGLFILIPNNKTLIAYSFSNLILSSWVSSIKLIKKPNSFKKKGIFYENEKIILKKGKSSK